jgi:hypothetical protein
MTTSYIADDIEELFEQRREAREGAPRISVADRL